MPSEEPRNYIRLGRFVLFLIILILLSSFIIKGPFKEWLNGSTFNFVFRSSGLSRIIQDDLSGKKGDYAIYIENLSDAENYGLRQSDIFPAASLYKLYLMAAILKEIDKGNLKLEDTVTSSKSRLIEIYGSTDSGYEEAPETISYTLDEALTRIGRVSDNFSSIMLTDKVGLGKIQEMVEELGAEDTRIKSPTLIVNDEEEPYMSTSASDISRFFRKLYTKEIVSVSVSDKLTEFLSLNQLNNRIPAGLPGDIKVIHKTGELARIRHDAGIVYLPEKAYIIVLMSQNIKGEDEVVETFVNISKDVYEYFQSKE